MTAKFEVDFGSTLKGLVELKTGISTAGRTLDLLGSQTVKVADKLAKATDGVAKKFESMSSKIGSDNAQLANAYKTLEFASQGFYNSVNSANLTATLRMKELLNKTSELRVTMSQTDALNRTADSLRKMEGAAHATAIKTAELTASTARLNTEEVKSYNIAKTVYDSQAYVANAYLNTSLALTKSTSNLQQATTTQGKEVAINKVLLSILNELSTARVRAEGVVQKQAQAEAMLNDGTTVAIAKNKIRLDTLLKLETAEARQAAELQVVQKQLELVTNATAAQIIQTKRKIAAVNEATSADERQTAFNAKQALAIEEYTRKIQFLASAKGKELTQLQQQYAEQQRQISLQNTITTNLTKEAERTAYLNSEKGRATEIAKVYNKALQESVTAEARLTVQSNKLAEQLKLVTGEQFKANSILEAKIQVETAAATAESKAILLDAKRKETLAELGRTRDYLNTKDGRAAELLKVEIAESKKAITATAEFEAAYKRQAQALVNLSSQKHKDFAANEVLLAGARNLAQAEAKQIVQQNQLRKELQLTNNARAREMEVDRALIEQAKAKNRVVADDIRFKTQQRAEIAAVTRQIAALSSEEGKRLVMLRSKLAEEKKALAQSTAAYIARNKHVKIGAQLTATMRATLQGMKTSIGMYTSSTILAASAAYALSRAIRSTIESGAEFQKTMARTKSIMGGSVPGDLKDDTFKAMEVRIRAVAKGIQFTATEVAKAVTELGQAGLSAGQAMAALPATLDLAIIGSVDTAVAADHATNIMMIFRKEAADLTGIVDVMAKAVTSSNTNVEQLANALTYAGPAADTLGLSLEETTAAIATLANSGFKASRAGTALRRLFVSLSAPTKKGQAVLDQFNVSVVNLRGETNSLNHIMGQLSRGMDQLTDVEQLAAVKDLVGVYASSPIAALIKQNKDLELMGLMLQRAGGEAAKMRTEIESALSFDYKTALSAFQEVQLSIFETLGTKLQFLTIRTAEWLSSLTTPLADGSAITQLDVLIDRFSTLGKVIVGFSALFIGKKLLGGLGSALLGTTKSVMAMGSQALIASRGVMAFGASSLYSATQANIAIAAYRATTAELTGLTGGMLTAAVAARALGAALSVLSTVGAVAYAAYTVYDLLFTDNNKDRIDKASEAVNKYADSYLNVRRNMQAAADAEAKAAEAKQRDLMYRGLESLEAEKRKWEAIKATSIGDKVSTKLADEEIKLLDNAIDDLKKSIKTTFTKLPSIANEEDISNLEKMSDALRSIQFWKRRVATEQFKLDLGGLTPVVKAEVQAKQKTAQDKLAEATDKANLIAQGQNESLRTNITLRKDSLALLEKEALNTDKLVADKKATDLEKQIIAEQKLHDQRTRLADLDKKLKDNTATPKEVDEYSALTKNIAKANTATKLAKAELEDFNASAESSIAAISLIGEKESARYARLNAELAETNRLKSEADQLMLSENPADVVKGEEQRARALKDVLKLKTEIQSIDDARNKKKEKDAGNDTGEKDELKRLKEAQTAYEALRAKYDQVGVSAEKLAKITEQLTYLKANDVKFTEEQYLKALRQAKIDHYAVVVAQDKQLQTLNKLREAYMASGIQKQVDDLAALEKAYEGVTDKGAEYTRIRESILKSARPAEGPTAQMPEATGPFSEFLRATVTRSNDLKTYDKSAVDLIGNHEKGNFQQQDKFAEAAKAQMKAYEDQQMSEAEHLAAMKKLGDEYTRGQLANTALYNDGVASLADQRRVYEEQSNMLVLASMAGSMGEMLGMIASASEDATGIQKLAFVAQKALAVAQIIMQSHVAAAMVGAQTGIAGIGLGPMILAQGYASAGLVAAMAIGELGSGGSSSSSGSYAGAYDKGGYIPTGKHGIVGEYGPEIVNGPAHVTGREATARKLGGNSGPQAVTISPQINIEYSSEGGSGGDSRGDAAMLANTVKLVVIDTIKNEMRPNGMLYRK